MGNSTESPAEEKTISLKQRKVSVVVADATLKNSFLFWVVYTLQVEKPSVLDKGWFYASRCNFLSLPMCLLRILSLGHSKERQTPERAAAEMFASNSDLRDETEAFPTAGSMGCLALAMGKMAIHFLSCDLSSFIFVNLNT